MGAEGRDGAKRKGEEGMRSPPTARREATAGGKITKLFGDKVWGREFGEREGLAHVDIMYQP